MSIFLFHRDFRTIDNTSLKKLSELSTDIHPIFIFNPDQVDSTKNPYYNEKAIQFMIECLSSIPHIQFFYGDTVEVLESLFTKNKITNLGFNLDYTPYAKKRTKNVTKLALKYNVNVVAEEDYTVLNMDEYREDGFYKVFKPFYEHLLTLDVPKPSLKDIKLSSTKLNVSNVYKFDLSFKKFSHRKDALDILQNKEIAKNYEKNRAIPAIETTHLSKYIKFGVVSIREVYYAYLKYKDLHRQVIWHDFYASLMYFLPEQDTIGGGNFKHLKIKWTFSASIFSKWCKGITGIPLIDAGMRQLNETGWMHNRIRLITSNFLTMVLKIDWRKGEKYFAKKLVDYDVSSNNLNWQFSAQVGTDRTPYVRIYNPFLQSKKYDPDCQYIKRWVPELKTVDNKDIHNWFKTYDTYSVNYPKPIIEY